MGSGGIGRAPRPPEESAVLALGTSEARGVEYPTTFGTSRVDESIGAESTVDAIETKGGVNKGSLPRSLEGALLGSATSANGVLENR